MVDAVIHSTCVCLTGTLTLFSTQYQHDSTALKMVPKVAVIIIINNQSELWPHDVCNCSHPSCVRWCIYSISAQSSCVASHLTPLVTSQAPIPGFVEEHKSGTRKKPHPPGQQPGSNTWFCGRTQIRNQEKPIIIIRI